MIPVANKPIIQHVIESLKDAGIQEVMVVVGYQGDQVTGFLGEGRELGVEVAYARQDKPLGTADALLKAEELISAEEDFLVVYGDVLFGDPKAIGSMVEFHEKRGPLATLGTCKYLGEAWKPSVYIRDDGSVEKILVADRRPPLEPINEGVVVPAGVFVFSREALGYVRRTPHIARHVFVGMAPPLEKDLYESVAMMAERGEDVRSFNLGIGGIVEARGFNPLKEFDRSTCIDVDRPDDVLDALNLVVSSMARKLRGVQVEEGGKISKDAIIEGPIYLGRRSEIIGDAYISGPCWIGKNTKILPGTRIEAGTVIGDGCVIGPHAWVKGSVGNRSVIGHCAEVEGVIMDNVYVYHYSEVSGIIGEGSDIGAGTVVGTWRFDSRYWRMRVGRVVEQVRMSGIVVGDYSRTGVNSMIMGGVKIGPFSVVGPGAIITQDVPPNKCVLVKQELVWKDWGTWIYRQPGGAVDGKEEP